MHGAGADFGVEGLLQDAAFVAPEVHKLEDQVLEKQALGFGFRFCFHRHDVSLLRSFPAL